MKKNIVIIIIMALVLIGGYFLLMGNTTAPVLKEGNQQVGEPINNENNFPATERSSMHQVIYSDNGYSPSETKVKVGDTVIFKNQSSSGMWAGSAMHPSHMLYGGTSLQNHCPDVENNDFDQCTSNQSGESWSFTFTKLGVWGYHNHLNPSHFGKVIVE